MEDRYYVSQTDLGYVIHDTKRILPLPFNFFSKQYADEACERFNRLGYIEVSNFYYTHKVAGTRDISQIKAAGKNPYKEWMKEHGEMFK